MTLHSKNSGRNKFKWVFVATKKNKKKIKCEFYGLKKAGGETSQGTARQTR